MDPEKIKEFAKLNTGKHILVVTQPPAKAKKQNGPPGIQRTHTGTLISFLYERPQTATGYKVQSQYRYLTLQVKAETVRIPDSNIVSIDLKPL